MSVTPAQAEQAASAVAAPPVPGAQPTPGSAAPEKKSVPKKAKKKKPAKPAPPPPPPPEEPLGAIIGVADAPRDYLSEKFVGLVSKVDRFFGDDRNFQESNDSVLQIDIDRLYGYGSVDKVVLSGRAKIRLPNTEKKLHFLIESDPDTNTNADTKRSTASGSTGRTTPTSYAAGVRYEKVEEERWHYSSDLGLQFRGLNTRPFVRGRVSYTQPVDEWRLKASETLFWFYTTGPGETTQLGMDRTLSDTLQFRSSSIATWLHDTQNLDLQQSFTYYHTLNKRTALIYQASAFAVTQPEQQVTDTVLLLGYRYRLHRKWMFFEVSPQL
ncbi:MAG: hypothetical protein V1879_05375, partial [Pseudomonadota bacterium]